MPTCAARNTTGKRKRATKKTAAVEHDVVVYCICHKPDDGFLMVGCDGGCDNWFHSACVGIDPQNVPQTYLCSACTPKKGRVHYSSRKATNGS